MIVKSLNGISYKMFSINNYDDLCEYMHISLIDLEVGTP